MIALNYPDRYVLMCACKMIHSSMKIVTYDKDRTPNKKERRYHFEWLGSKAHSIKASFSSRREGNAIMHEGMVNAKSSVSRRTTRWVMEVAAPKPSHMVVPTSIGLFNG